MKEYDAIIWYEYETLPPRQYRTRVSAGRPETAAYRSVKECRKGLPKARPVSVLVRLESVAPGTADAILED